jgi:hypothetical protein
MSNDPNSNPAADVAQDIISLFLQWLSGWLFA